MTEKDIKKALRLCKQNTVCKGCSYINNGCLRTLMQDTLNLINSKNAEIASLQEQNKINADCAARQYKEIERLKGYVVPTLQLMSEYDIKRAKSTAIKDFEKLLIDNVIYETYSKDFLIVFIKEFARRMVGDA